MPGGSEGRSRPAERDHCTVKPLYNGNRYLAYSGRRWSCEPGEDSVSSHGLGEDRAASGVRRLRRPVAPGRKESPAE